jgi:bacterioferritin-associated ferredoxin
MYVCHCYAVTDRHIRDLCAAGAATLEDVGQACGAGRSCTSCHEMIERLLYACGDPCGQQSLGRVGADAAA